MWKDSKQLTKIIRSAEWAKACQDDDTFWNFVVEWIKRDILPDFLTEVTHQVDEIIDMTPDLPEPDLFGKATEHMVEFLGAHSASVRIYDPQTAHMLSYGSFPSKEDTRETYIPLEGSVAGEVVKTHRTYLVPNILKETLYQDKNIIERKGTYSLMAVPLGIPRFFPNERDMVGVIQIYYHEKNRTFTPLEIQVAEVMARRLSFVIARKKIFSMHMVNEKKEDIVRQIFLKLGTRGGVKMKEVFNRVIPELVEIINIQSCALFSVSEDFDQVVLEAGYPDQVEYHGIGKTFALDSEPVFEVILNLRHYKKDSPYEMVTPSYVLVMDPQKSELVSQTVKKFSLERNINSILYVPLSVGEDVTHFMTFDALDQRQRYSEGEIEIFLFLGQELMKAQRMERLDDILHDFKNPAIATAGFARRLSRLLERNDVNKDDPKVKKYVSILLEETSRLQEMAMSLYHVGEEQIVDLNEILRNRFEINREAIREQLKQNVTLKEEPFADPLYVSGYLLHIERVLDNVLNNATNAIPLQGGILAIRSFEEGKWACVEITNTGQISEEERRRLIQGEGRGRGLYIIHRIIQSLKGKIDIRVGRDTTTLIVRLPLQKK